ncbi:choice-of-anchor M domain-containing protein [Streptomyces liangshanensis]|uniref:Surface-anchored protein n=1 Tax=Streptomyces liangshanensis TaxID=2717324 RepID=A0A6G9GSA2_9ACTN|nr:choice-of-anchor M domain-containing protein [Streptomyces liangshanensis]QIQ01074.1 hypothetical protein HA039_01075 [Streptomyces liangshanensis]
MTTTLTRAALFTGAAAASLALAAAPAQAAPITLSAGHVDVVDIAYEDGALELGLHDETTGTPVERDPAEVTLRVKPEARTQVPANRAYAFLGAAGAPVWILPQTSNPNLLFAGWAAHEVPTGVFQNNSVRLTLASVSGPADVSVYDVTLGTPVKKFDSGDGLPDTVVATAGEHHHTNWAFEAAGTYTLTFRASGTLTDGTTVTSAPVAYHFTVG